MRLGSVGRFDALRLEAALAVFFERLVDKLIDLFTRRFDRPRPAAALRTGFRRLRLDRHQIIPELIAQLGVDLNHATALLFDATILANELIEGAFHAAAVLSLLPHERRVEEHLGYIRAILEELGVFLKGQRGALELLRALQRNSGIIQGVCSIREVFVVRHQLQIERDGAIKLEPFIRRRCHVEERLRSELFVFGVLFEDPLVELPCG